MWEFVKSLLSSKKFVVTLAAVAAWGAKQLGWDIPEDQLAALLLTLAAFVVGQGLADVGKEKAKTLVAAAKEGAAPPDPS